MNADRARPLLLALALLVIAGGPAPLVATWLLAQTGSGYAIAFAILGCSVVTVIAVSLMRDHSHTDLDDDAAYGTAYALGSRTG